MYLDEIDPIHQEVGYGELGTLGNLGYEDKRVIVMGEPYSHALSSHAPSRLVFPLAGRFDCFTCDVALNDDSPPHSSSAAFTVCVDGICVAHIPEVTAGQPTQSVVVPIGGAQHLELTVHPHRWNFCHSVWLNPRLYAPGEPVEPSTQPLYLDDSLQRAQILLHRDLPPVKRCIASIVSPGYTHLLDDMLGSLRANGNCSDAGIVVFAVDPDKECKRIITKYGATAIDCISRRPPNATLKSVLYSVARVVEAQQYLCLDADMLIMRDLTPLFAALEACAPNSILVSRDSGSNLPTLGAELCNYYEGSIEDIALLLGSPNAEAEYPLVANDGIFAGERMALLALDATLRRMQPHSLYWIDALEHHTCRNQFLFNLAVAHLRAGVELNRRYNVQLHREDVTWEEQEGTLQALWHGQPARILHFCGPGRNRFPEYRGRFAHDPGTSHSSSKKKLFGNNF